jgi:prepilin-type N-terminal cleavage/methylation domain-containing protein
MKSFSRRHNQKGFTLVELMIATTVFSVILLLCTFGLISVGRSYYKGVTVARTQEVARTIMDDITQAVQFSGGNIETALAVDASFNNVNGFCVNNKRYSFIREKLLGDNPSDHALVADLLGSACSAGLTPQNINNAALDASSKEFLLPNMRVADISITPAGGRLYRVSVRIVAGDDGVLEQEGTPDVRCSNNASESQFCAVANLTSIVEKRLE